MTRECCERCPDTWLWGNLVSEPGRRPPNRPVRDWFRQVGYVGADPGVVVVRHHTSGRSAGATSSNPRGYWEPRAVIALNEAILRRSGNSGYDLSLERGTKRHDAADIAAIRSFLSTLPAAPVVVIKEPKLTAVSDLWFEAARGAGYDVAAVIAVRHPGSASGRSTSVPVDSFTSAPPRSWSAPGG